MRWREELAWAAGFFDGEGYVGLRPRGPRHHDQLQLAAPQIDRRVLDRFDAIVAVGKVYGPYPPQKDGWGPRFHYVAVDFANVQAVIALLWEWLSPVKREQARAALVAGLEAKRHALGSPGSRPLCKRGHEFDRLSTQKRGANVYR